MKRSQRQRVVVAFVALLLLVLAQGALAQETVTYDAINDVAKELFCPVCESEPLDTCATQACQDWREEIGRQLADGRTKAEIHENFRQRYGDRVLANPPAEGLNLVLWLGIPVAVIIGGFFFVRYLRQLRTPAVDSMPSAPAAPTADTTALDPYLQQIEEEVQQR